MTVTLVRFAETGDFNPADHPRGPDGRFTHSFAALMSAAEKGRARKAAAAFSPKRGVNTPDGARTYLSGIGQTSPATRTYFAGGHAEVNQALRAGKDDYPGIKAMDSAMTALPDDVLVQRRVPAHMLGDATPEQLVGFKVVDAGFTAGSLADLEPGQGDVHMHIAVPAGTRAAVNPDSGAIVLDRGLELAVLHVAPNDRGGRDMYLTVLPKGDGRDGGGPDVPGGTPHGGAPEAVGDGRGLPGAPAAHAGDGEAGGNPAPGRSPGAGPASTGEDRSQTTGDGSAGAAKAGGPAAGSRSVLDRATAGATDEPQSLGGADPELRDAMHQAFDVQSGGLSASLDDQVSQTYRDGDGRVVVRAEGYIRNKDGKVVGSFRRLIYPETGEVHNDTFALSGPEQGSGFAQQFAQQAEPELAKLGLTHATVSASGVGGYAWRRYGWDPDSPAAAGDVPDRLRSVTAQYDLSPEDKATVSGWLKAFQQPDQSKWPTPEEIGAFGKGRYTRTVDGRDMWPGKDVLVDSAWKGRRDLNAGS
jgi:hypothetical protein